MPRDMRLNWKAPEDGWGTILVDGKNINADDLRRTGHTEVKKGQEVGIYCMEVMFS